MRRILLIDDDELLAAPLASFFERFEFALDSASSPSAGLAKLRAQSFDAAILDVMLPEMDGFALCREIRRESDIPIIMLTAQGDPASRIVGLELGADDYLPKPFEPRELVARINAVLRRCSAARSAAAVVAADATTTRVGFKGWVFDRFSRELRSPQQVVVALSNAEFRLLSAFVDRPRRVLSRDRLLDLSRAPGVDVTDRAIDLAVSRLRQKLSDSPRDPSLIRTVRGEGYAFDADVDGVP